MRSRENTWFTGLWSAFAVRIAPVAMAAAMLTAPSLMADDIPFWGDETPATNRVCAAVASNTTAADFDSRLYAYVEFLLNDFSTMPLGMFLLIK